NSANGITVTDASRAEIRDNVFQETGFGINIAQKAQPVVVNNQITNNRSGIIVQASSRPILRKNVIEGNREDGLVVLGQAQPDLGNTSEAGGNQFRNNARYDINASAAKQIIAAYGNVIAGDRIVGTVNTGGTIATTENSSSAAIAKNSTQQTQVTQEITFSAPSVSTNTITSTGKLPPPPAAVSSSTNNAAKPLNSQLLPLQPANTTSKVVVTVTQPKQPARPVTSGVVTNSPKPKPLPSRNAAGFPSPSSLTPKQTVAGWQQQATTPQVNYVQMATPTIEFVAPQPQSPINPVTPIPVTTATNQIQTLPALQPPPTSSNISVGNQLPVSENSTTTAYAGGELGMRYRVITEVQTQKDQELVRFLAPGAFPTFWQGRAVMQAGVFSNRHNAEQMLTILNHNGLRTMIEPIGY
ncbi:hypothetical protein CBP15_22185, partial [Fischerella thermalis WC442]